MVSDMVADAPSLGISVIAVDFWNIFATALRGIADSSFDEGFGGFVCKTLNTYPVLVLVAASGLVG